MATRQLFTGADWTRHYILFIAISFVLTALLMLNTGWRVGLRSNTAHALDAIQGKVQGASR